MRKEVIKCDSCGKEITEGGFYNLTHENIYGWAQFYYPHPDGIPVRAEICIDCFDKIIKPKK